MLPAPKLRSRIKKGESYQLFTQTPPSERDDFNQNKAQYSRAMRIGPDVDAAVELGAIAEV